eukprot:CAMPEP_0172543232 /NCGR_PEP_ID=MMETSP1067-20121228/13682_1 /TAXON_ID=265564 ORGANISM="Thalassiosira punctigera, Strain Tpunct2005C2" /NCGR_SAMPLE_ID=MMETSP1067 /ASSEMBLY_ACC=CAM_ASM_000444 /LENGTH=137 /DNA_ID=CAMNT_0013329613 /DNA_START=59 /DNA_END=469 /DNA_ORIENTATION=-
MAGNTMGANLLGDRRAATTTTPEYSGTWPVDPATLWPRVEESSPTNAPVSPYPTAPHQSHPTTTAAASHLARTGEKMRSVRRNICHRPKTCCRLTKLIVRPRDKARVGLRTSSIVAVRLLRGTSPRRRPAGHAQSAT